MSRSKKKGPYVDKKLLAKVRAMNEKGEKRVIRTWARKLYHRSRDGRSYNYGS